MASVTELSGDFTSHVVILENRPSRRMTLQLNLSVYLDAKVTLVGNPQQLAVHLEGEEKPTIVIARATLLEEESVVTAAGVPLYAIGELGRGDAEGVERFDDDAGVKPILQAAAKLLGITAASMVARKKQPFYPISTEFLKLLFTAPADLFSFKGTGDPAKVLAAGDTIPKARLSAVAAGGAFCIDSMDRLKFANAFTAQMAKATDELTDAKGTKANKMQILSSSVDIVAGQFQNSGMDEEVVRLAQASISAMAQVAKSSGNIGKLVEELLASQAGYRYAHSQLNTFLSFHIVKKMGWWGEENSEILSQASFYHDIVLDDETAQIRTQEELDRVADPALKEKILAHPQLAAREMQAGADIDPAIVRVVMQHHGSKIGKGFAYETEGLEKLAKVFLIAEEWTDYLMAVTDGKTEPKHEERIQALKARYRDSQCLQMIQTLRYLDPDAFAQDFSGGVKVMDETETVVKAAAAVGSEAERIVKGAQAKADDAAKKVSGGAGAADAGTKVKGGPAETMDTTETKIAAAVAEIEALRKVTVAALEKAENGAAIKAGIQKVFDDSITKVRGLAGKESDLAKVKGGLAEIMNDVKTKVSGHVDQNGGKDKLTVLKGMHAAFDETIKRFAAGPAPAAPVATVVKGGPVPDQQAKIRASLGMTPMKWEEKLLLLKKDPAVTPLMKSVLTGDLKAVEEMLKKTGEATKTDTEGRTALHYAVMANENPDIMKMLMGKGVPKNACDSKRQSAVFIAALEDKRATFEFLVKAGCRANTQAMGGLNVAMMCAFNGDLSGLRLAIENGCALDVVDHGNRNTLAFAKLGGNTEVVQFVDAEMKKLPPKGAAAKKR